MKPGISGFALLFRLQQMDYLVQICGENRLQISVMNFLVMIKICVAVHSVHSNVARIHSRLPAAMEF
ncbi:hypothetical protein DWY28_04350 [Ruminococcus sp. AF24-32LB]|nr:hypothetical protein DWV90_03070 [Ruminococcus sp. AF13-37]RGW23937.1 hypothetical protein DWV87_04065 [Ruminococcus sp. AF13-28]RHG56549.1 hypothetical protein DW253_05755 [Ruminococcus sp. AM22-13]RHJ95845.1 hypothetical protein DW098_11135 [Ruminococcus sp. AM07-21]RHQ66189.1 hypothetical protein DWY28_04350 [Ruminococcus sp. AF24-32LB]